MRRNLRNTILAILIGFAVGICLCKLAITFFGVPFLVGRLIDSFSNTTKENEMPIHKAARRGIVKEIEQLLDSCAYPDTKDEHGRTPLHIAALYGRTEVVKLLLKHGGDVEARDNNNCSPLYLAALNNRVGVIEQLVSSGAEVDGQNGKFDETALFAAVEKGRENAAKVLLKHGADVNLKISAFPHSPLQMAAVVAHVNVAKILLANGANVNERDAGSGMTAMYIATVARNKKMVSLLGANGADSTIEDNYGQNPEQAAAIMKLRGTRKLVAAKDRAGLFNQHAIVQILYFGIKQTAFSYRGNRIAFVIGDGSLLVTAAHCIDDITEDNRRGILVKPQVISRYYGDIFEAEILAVDEEADVAILHVSWDGHPALELATMEELSDAKQIIIAAYPPPKKSRAKHKFYRDVFWERLPIVKLDDAGGKKAVVTGGSRFMGRGWSGSPMILPDTGKLAGVFGNVHRMQTSQKVFFEYFRGCNVGSIYSLLRKVGVNPEKQNNEIIKRKPDAEKAFSILIDCLEAFVNQSVPLAASRAKKLVRLRPQSVNIHLLLASLAEANKDIDKQATKLAESSHKEALKLAPQSFMAHASYGNFLLRNKRNNEAIIEFKKAIELEPDNSFVLVKLVKILKGRDAGEAEVFARRLVEKYPENADFWFEFSAVLEKTGKRQEEVKAAKKAVSISKNVPYQHRRRLADALVKVKQLDQAKLCFELLLKDHECARCWLAYAKLLIKLGPDRYGDAIKAIKKAESMNQDKLVSPESLKELQEKLTKDDALRELEVKG
ncbi:MAG: ankyrin repeat domain-containing protein [Planctomycetes bacterium]|nr:ankyrin repeat domain-containing protein [Planctomycetota bacterium]MCH8121106.1 ankyrin repeat domain-containing protein [Planctomycetota bacterium]